MWRWIVQPGTLITQPAIAKHAGLTTLGSLTILATVLSTLYVTAATALVQSILKESEWHHKVMVSSVSSDFAYRVEESCNTPIKNDPDYAMQTCNSIQNVGRSYYNQAEFLAEWAQLSTFGNSSTDQRQRPAGLGLPYANSTILAQWMNVVDTAETSRRYQRVINNVSLAVPHIGVVNAINDQRNRMPQAADPDSVGPYSLWASVPSPVLKVLCVHMNETELAPIYDTWNDEVVNSTTWTRTRLQDNATTTNDTVVDDIFGWTKIDSATMRDYPPVFSRFPKPFNTILNHTSYYWGRSAIYVLGQGAAQTDGYAGPIQAGQYPLCKLEIDLTPFCSTRYSVAVAGRTLEVLCEDRAGEMQYVKTMKRATTIDGVSTWRDLGTLWSNSLSLGSGIADVDDSISRILMQLALVPERANDSPPVVNLSPLSPSLAEALAILASDTLISSMQNAPVVLFFNYTMPKSKASLPKPQTQWFEALLKSGEYASGGVDNASKGWLVILISTLILNALMLLYFVKQPGLITDYSQPLQLFALAF